MKSSFLVKRKNGIEWLAAPNLAQFPWLLHAFSTRRGGTSKPPAAGLNLGTARQSQPQSIAKNRRMFFEAIGATAFSLASIHQIHSAEILQVAKSSKAKLQYRPTGCESGEECAIAETCGDALLTEEARLLLSVRTADCLPILVVDPGSRVAAAIHAGWRGALARITEKTLGEMRRCFGSNPRRLFAALGPCIHPCCYEVGEEVVDAFSGRFAGSEKYFQKATELDSGKRNFPPFLSMTPPGHDRPAGSGFCLDLVAVARDQLRSAGVPASHIQASDFCTSCRTDLFFSYRKEGSATGRMMAVIGMRK
ncbi:MAG: peptidoglycan editing factor PgeF [Terriglobia bacterium]